MLDDILKDPNLARFLVVAIAIEARKKNVPIKRQDFLVGFGRLVRSLVQHRGEFMNELRTMEREGPDAYLRRISTRLTRNLS